VPKSSRRSYIKHTLFAAVVICGFFLNLQDSRGLFYSASYGRGISQLLRGPGDDEDDDYRGDDLHAPDSSDDDEEEEVDHPELVAPRSHDGPYDEYIPGEEYLIYSPSGGFSNQRMELEYAVEIAKLLNRTVYVPMCGRHSNGWMAYNLLKEGTDLFPMDRVLDFPFITEYDHRSRLVPLNTSVYKFVSRFEKQYGSQSVLKINGLSNYYGRDQIIRWRKYRHPLMFFRGPGFFHQWFSSSQMLGVRKRIRFTKYLRDLAVKVANAALGDQFYAMHIRMGDYAYRRTGDGGRYLSRAYNLKWKIGTLKTYIATEPQRDEKFFEPLNKGLKAVYSQDIPKDLVQDFKNAFPRGKFRSDMIGLLEQLICVQAKSFIGTYFSTFSAYIMFMRENKAQLFPELVNLDTSEDGNEGET